MHTDRRAYGGWTCDQATSSLGHNTSGFHLNCPLKEQAHSQPRPCRSLTGEKPRADWDVFRLHEEYHRNNAQGTWKWARRKEGPTHQCEKLVISAVITHRSLRVNQLMLYVNHTWTLTYLLVLQPWAVCYCRILMFSQVLRPHKGIELLYRFKPRLGSGALQKHEYLSASLWILSESSSTQPSWCVPRTAHSALLLTVTYIKAPDFNTNSLFRYRKANIFQNTFQTQKITIITL